MPKTNEPKEPLSSVTVTPCPHGVQGPVSNKSVTMHDYSDQPPKAEVIGEAVLAVLTRMMRDGYDPAHGDFVLLVTFR